MRRRPLHAPATTSRINVTPMIDVVMCLIVFFLIVGKLAADRVEPVPLPDARAGQPPEGAGELIVNLVLEADEPTIIVEGVALSPDGLEEVVRSVLTDDPARTIRLRADKAIPFGRVRPVLEACRRAGATGVRLGAEQA
ncbi:MAG: ExbD/TolR family protein [Phycisphaerales bacterium JB037]